MLKRAVKRALCLAAACTILMSGGWGGTVQGAVMDTPPGGYETPDTDIGDDPFNGILMGSRELAAAFRMGEEEAPRSLAVYNGQSAVARRGLSDTDRMRANLILDARKYLGTPYLFGAKYGQTETFDCSSFVKTVFAQNGIELPRVSRSQALEGRYVSRSDLQPGDLVFFTTEKSDGRIGHVGLYAGDGMMIHTYGNGGVKYSTIESGWWSSRYVTARRLIRE